MTLSILVLVEADARLKYVASNVYAVIGPTLPDVIK